MKRKRGSRGGGNAKNKLDYRTKVGKYWRPIFSRSDTAVFLPN